MLQNAYLLAKIGFDTTENEPAKILGKNCKKLVLIMLHSLRGPLHARHHRGPGGVEGHRLRELGLDCLDRDEPADAVPEGHLAKLADFAIFCKIN